MPLVSAGLRFELYTLRYETLGDPTGAVRDRLYYYEGPLIMAPLCPELSKDI